MGSNFVIAALAIERGRNADWKAAHLAVDAYDVDPDGPNQADDVIQYVASPRERMHEALDRLEGAIDRKEGPDDLDYIDFAGWRIWLTGGMSWGDSPTELFGLIADLPESIRRVAGFDWPSNDQEVERLCRLASAVRRARGLPRAERGASWEEALDFIEAGMRSSEFD